MSNFNDEYQKLRKKRLAEENSQAPSPSFSSRYLPSNMYGNNNLGAATNLSVYTKASTPTKEEKQKWWQGYLETPGAFSDGSWDFGDVTKTILGTVEDAKENMWYAALDATENLIDTGAYVVGLFGNKNFKQKVGDFIAKEPITYGENAEKVNKFMNWINPNTWASNILGVTDDVDNYSILGEKTDGFVQSTTHMAGSMALQSVGVPWWLTQGVNAWGSSTEEAFKEDAGYGEAAVYGGVSVAAEILTEKLFGGSGLGEKGLIDTSGLTKGISNKLVKALADYGINMGTEAAEEVLAQVATNAASATFKEEDAWTLITNEDAINSYIDSAIGGAALGGVMNAGKFVGSVKEGRDYNTGLTANEQKVVDKEVENRIAEAEKDGKTLSKKDKAKIQEAVMEDLKKGYISTNTIESVLGGDTYKSYQDALNNEQSILDEYKKLGAKENPTLADQKRFAELEEQIKGINENSKSKQLGSQLSSEVQSLFTRQNGKFTQTDNYLMESYNERARRGQAFEADLSKYDTKQAETLQKAIDSGILNNTNRTHEFVDMVAKISADKGVSFDFANNAKLKESGFAIDGKTINGYVTKDGVTVNIDSAKSLNSVVGHEITHVLEGTELYAEMQKALFEYAKSKNDYQGRLDTLTKLYENVKDADVNAELTADLVGDYLFTDNDFIMNLSTKNRNVFQKIYDEIKYLLKIATAGSKEAKELEKVKRAFEKAYKESGKTSGDTKYSLSDSDGKQLTKEQSEYFKDSKMRDENGNLKVMYHGSQDAGFHVFDPSMSDDGISLFFVDRNDVATSYSGTSETYEAQTIRTAEDMNNFLAKIGYDHYEAVERNGKFELLENNEHVAWSDTAQGIYEEFCWYEGVGEGDANYKVYLNLTNPLVVDAKGSEWSDIPLSGETLKGINESWDNPDPYGYIHTATTRQLAEYAKASNYDGVIIKNVRDNGGYSNGSEGTSTVAIAFNSEQVKSVANEKPTANKDIRYSLSSMANTFFGDENMSANDFAKVDYKQTQGYKEYVNQCVNNYKQTRTDFDEVTARREIKEAIDGIVKVALAAKKAGYDIQDNAAKRSTKDSKNRLLFSSLEPNSDYFTSNDISTICDKRQNFADIYDDIVKAEEAKGVPQGKRFFDNVDNYFYLHKLMADKGLTQPCRQCYVESMRKNLAPMANAFLKLVQETDANNLANDQLYHPSGKNKGALKTNNAATREWVLDKLSGYGMSASDLNVEMLTTEDGLAQLKIQAPMIYEAFNSFYGQSKPKMPKAATPFRFGELTALLTDERGKIKQSLVDKINSTGGFRLQSYSDFQIKNYTDTLQVIFEAGTLGLNGHAYTKVPAFLDATEGTGLKRNISIFMYKDGNEWKLDRNDSFPAPLEEIYDIVNADKSGNTSIIAVSQNADMSAWIMANDNVGYGIPFHKSGMKMGTVRDTNVKTEDGRIVKGYSGTIDHTKQQTEVWAKTNGDNKALTKVKKGVNIYRFWDFDNKSNLSKNELIEKNVKAYIDACEDMGYLPKFRDYVINNEKVLNNVLKYSKELGFVSQDATIEDISFEYKTAERTYRIPYGYYKFLGDFGMFTPDGKASSHEVLSLKNYDFDKAVQFFADSRSLRRNEILQQFANDGERQKYRDSDLSAEDLEKIVKQKRGEIVEDVVAPTKNSLTPEGETPKTYGRWNVFAKDILLDKGEIAPTQDTAQNVQENVQNDVAPTPEAVAPDYATDNEEEAPSMREIYGEEYEPIENAYTVEQEIKGIQDEIKAVYEEYHRLKDEGKDAEAQPLFDKFLDLNARARELFGKAQEYKAEERGYLDSLTDADAPPELEAPYNLPKNTITLKDKALDKVTKQVNDILGLDAEESAEMAKTIQRYAQNENMSESELFEEIKKHFQFHEEISNDTETLSAIKKRIRGTKIFVPADLKADFNGKRKDGFNGFRQENFGRFTIKTKDASGTIGIDQLYQDLAEAYPEYFPDDIWNPADQLIQIADVVGRDANIEYASMPFDDETIQEVCDVITSGVTKYSHNEIQKQLDIDRNSFYNSIGVEEDIAPTFDTARADQNPGQQTMYDDSQLFEDTETEEEPPKIAKVLESTPKTPKKVNLITKIRNLVFDKQSVIEDISLKTKNRELMGKADFMLRSESRAQRHIKNKLMPILERVEATGNRQAYEEYAYHLHNVDRMSLEGKAQARIDELKGKFENLKPEQIRAIAAKKITENTTERTANTIREAKEYLNALETKNKPVFGDSVTADVSREFVKNFEAEHKDAREISEAITEYNSELRQMLVDGGIISKETADLWAEMYPHYVPIRRAGKDGAAVKVPLDTMKTGVNAPIARAKGGNSDIESLLDVMGSRTEQVYRAVARNSFGVELMHTLDTVTDTEATSIDEILDSFETEELLKKGENGANPTFTVFEDGKRITFDITEELYDALKPANDLLKTDVPIMNLLTKIQRGILTQYNPTFIATNAAKDMQDVLVNSQHAGKTYANVPLAVKELIKGGKWITEYMDNGGEDLTYFDSKTQTFKKDESAVKKVLGFVPNGIAKANDFVEKIPRLAEYIASRKKGASIEVAMLDAARVTTNFAAGGDLTKFANKNGFTFLNASIQGFNQQVRNVREAKANGLKGVMQLAAKFAVAGLPVMLLNAIRWEDDEEYEELSDYIKDNYYIVAKTKDGKFVRIPKGRAVAVIQNAFEQMKNLITGDDEVDMARFGELMINNLAPNNPLENNILAPIGNVINNKTWYGEDLVPTRLQDLPAAEQFDETTDSISKWLGEVTNTSPYKWNYLLDQYSGGVGDVILPMLTPESDGGGLLAPVKDKFTTDSVMKNQNVSDFYEKVDELTKNANSMKATDEDVLMSKYMNSISAELGELYKQKREIQSDTSISDAAKDKKVREIQAQINELAKESLNTYADVSIDGQYATVGDLHYRWYEPSEDSDAEAGWQKVSDKQLEKQDEVTSGLGITPSEYWSNKEEYDYAYDYPGKYAVSKAVGGYKAYKSYSSELYDIKADKDEDGKSISGSRKEKVIEYINNLDADYGTKIILFKSEYNADDTYNYDIIDYLNSRDDISYKDMETILKELGFTIDSNGNISWD